MKKIICLFLAAIMILTLVLSAVVTASAADVPAIDFDQLLGKLPGKPVVTVEAETIVGNPVVFSWEETTNTTSYTLVIEQQDGENWNEIKSIPEATSPVSVELPLGNYRVVVFAYNANNSNIDTASDDVAFKVRPDVLVGDMNNDGVVSDSDAIYLLRHTLFEEDFPLNQSGDMNSDGVVSDSDAIYLLRHTLFEEDFPLP